MRIAVNTRLLLPGKLEGIGWFTHETFSRIVKAHPGHEFTFIFDRRFDQQWIYSHNVNGVVLPPPTRHPLLYRVWFDLVLPWYLARQKFDAFISPDGSLPLRSGIPSLAVIHDLNFEHYPADLPKAYSNYYRSYFPRFAKHATRIATVSGYSKQDISATYAIDPDKIDVVYNGIGEKFRPLDAAAKIEARQRYAAGSPYLICVGSLHPRKNISRLLEAFDRMVSMHDVPHKLVIAGESFWWDDRMKNAWARVRNKERIQFTGRLSQDSLCSALGGADALAFVSYFEGFGIPLAEAMKSGVPVVAANATSLPEIGGDAAVYCDPFDIADISVALHRVITDMPLRAQMIARGQQRARAFTWENSAEALWRSFERMMRGMGRVHR